MLFGLCCSLAAWLRGGSAAAGFAGLFALGVLHQLATQIAGSDWPLPADPALIAEGSLLAAGLAALLALRALHRTTRERDRVEDLHWTSMEVIRGMHELASQPGAGLAAKLTRVLALGAEHFRLDHAIACRLGEGAPEILAWRSGDAHLSGEELAATLAPRLRLAAQSTGPLAVDASAEGASSPAFAAFLGAPVRAGDEVPCVVAFAGARREERFTATDKDLIGWMADWLRGEILLCELGEKLRRQAARTRASVPARERRDLNGAVRRVEARLRSLVGAHSTLELKLADALPPLSAQRIPLESLVESLVVAAQDLVKGGTLRVETASLCAPGEGPGPAAHATLSVRARGDAAGAEAVERSFAPPGALDALHGGALPLSQVEALLRRAGGDLSVQLEPGRGALLTAFLPGVPARPLEAHDPPAVARDA
jgi:hypothetical protein